jgi:hypothetical protein
MLRLEGRHEEDQCFNAQTDGQHKVSTLDVGQLEVSTDHNDRGTPTVEVSHKGFELSRSEELLEFAKFFLCHDNLILKVDFLLNY